MKTRINSSLLWLIGLSLLAPALLTAQPPAPALGDYRIELLGQVDSSAFPDITLQFRVVNQAGELARDFPNEPFIILEDGKEVKRFFPTGLRTEPMSVVLALDTSGSMERPTAGESQRKLAAAQEAARRFFGKLDPPAPAGLVLFHHEPYQRQPPGLSREPLLQLVAEARPRGGTAYFDATAEAIQLLARAPGPGQRAVVLMTDGRDMNSKRTLEDVLQEARRHRVRLYTMGLGQSGRNDPVRTVLVLDRSGSMEGAKFEGLKKAAQRFVELLPPQLADTTLIPFDDQVTQALPFSNDHLLLDQTIRRLTLGGETALYDATYEAIDTLNAGHMRELGNKGQTRRAVVVLTDGEDTSSRRRETDVIERAVRDGVKVYLLGLGDRDQINEPAMQSIAEKTGGQYFYVHDPDHLTEIFEELSIRLHDDGIDEIALQRLARETGGEYYPVADADKLAGVFERVATRLEPTYAVTFRSHRSRHDGTSRGIVIRFGDIAVTRAAYTTHGLITPTSSPSLYLGLLALLLGLLAVPTLVRKWFRRAAPRAA